MRDHTQQKSITIRLSSKVMVEENGVPGNARTELRAWVWLPIRAFPPWAAQRHSALMFWKIPFSQVIPGLLHLQSSATV